MLKFFTLFAAVVYLAGCGKTEGYAPSAALIVTSPGSAPGSLVITSPVTLTKLSNTAITVTGICQTAATVYLTGDSAQSMVCVASAFSFTVTKASSGTYTLNFYQTNTVGSSATVKVMWTFDNVTPASVVISSPLSNPYASGDSAISISGSCETGATVAIVGDHTASTTCAGGSFIFSGISKAVDASYVFNITQTDAATNASAATTFTWVRDTTIPGTPTITNFTDNPRYTKTSPLTVAGACVAGDTVAISEGGVDLGSQVCAGTNTYSINIAKGVDGTYTLALYQTDPVSLNDSANRDFTWIYDTVAPAAPLISNPTVSPVTTSGGLTISGTCEVNATVNLTGDDTQSVVCGGGSFSFSITEAMDGTYNYSLTQTDLALNVSGSVAQQWIKDTTALTLPTIDTPSVDPYVANSTNLILAGTCDDGLTVILSGVAASDVLDPANSLTTTCAGSVYSFTIFKTDGTYLLSIYQTNGVLNSGSVTQSWTKDTLEPNTTITSTPPATNYSTQATFVFSGSEAGTFECSLDSGPYITCVSPKMYTDLSNMTHTMSIREIDLANNVESTPATYSWVHTAAKAVALYHLDLANPTLDSGLYTGPVNNTLTVDTSADSGAAVFAEGRTMATTANYMTVPNTASQAAITSYLTLESRVQIPVLPGGGTYLPIVSKYSVGAASFEYGIKRVGGGAGKYYIYFLGSTNGTSFTEKKSTQLSAAEVTALASGYNYIAVTWNLGSIRYYVNGVAKGSSVIGTAGTTKLAASTGLLRLGYSANGNYSSTARLDEVRISQIVRPSLTTPVTAYTAD